MVAFNRKRFDSFEDLFLDQLCDLYDAEIRWMDLLPKMIDAAGSSELKELLQQHRDEVKGQVSQLELTFRRLGREPERRTCEAMKGLAVEAQEILDAEGDPHVKDAGIIAGIQRIKHYEIAGYGTARAFAQRLGHTEEARLLQEMLDEECDVDKRLTQVAEESVNVRAQYV